MDDKELREILATVAEKHSWMKDRSVTAKHIRGVKDAEGVSIGTAIEAMRIVATKVNIKA